MGDDYSGLQVIDVADPAHPRLVGGMDTSNYATGIAVTPDCVLIADSGPVLAAQLYCSPESSVEDPGLRSATSLLATPNPARGGVTLRLVLPPAGLPGSRSDLRLSIHDCAGRLVRRVTSAAFSETNCSLYWDWADDRGEPVPTGIYFARLALPQRTETERIVMLR